MELTLKQKAFADYYIETGNATESAIRAGYNQKTARAIGCENLTKPNIKSYIDERMQEIENSRIADAKEVLELLTSMARGEVKEEVVVTEGVGEGMSEAKIIKKQLSAKDRIKAAELIGKRYRMFTDKIEADVTQTVIFEGEDLLED